ncbi:MAG: SH3 domain-containing protein [Lachnospiraceae bacterium]
MIKSGFVSRHILRGACMTVAMVCIICFLPLSASPNLDTTVLAAEEDGMIQPSSAKIYSSMSENSDIIANLIVGNVFEVLEAESDASGGIWYRVKTDFGAEGYVKASEMDRLIMDAQAIMPPAAADTGGDEPSPGGDNDAEAPPEENDGGDAEAPEGDNGGDAEVPPEENDNGEETVQAENPAGDEPVSEETVLPVDEPVSDFVDGAGFGKDTDSQDTDSATTGSEGFTVIERTESPKAHRHGKIDAVLMMIIAGGVICIIAIAALLRKMVKCVRTEM